MSNQIIVATFNNSNAAYDAVAAMKMLKDQGLTDFKPKAGVMVKKDDLGNLSLLESKERPLWGTAVGTAALGAALGAMSGLTGDAVMDSLDSDFVDSVTKDMRPGMTAIVVEADEKSTRPVDDIVQRGGGHVYRQDA